MEHKVEPGDKVTVNIPGNEFHNQEGTVEVLKPYPDYPAGIKFPSKAPIYYFAENELELGWKSDLVLVFCYSDGRISTVMQDVSVEALAEAHPNEIYFEATVTEN